MSAWNVPDDWGMYYYACGCHASGGCDCPENLIKNAERSWLEDSGYELDESMTWHKLVSFSVHTCRRNHKDGRIKRGDRYKVTVHRHIDDEDGRSFLNKQKTLIKKPLPPPR